MPSATCRPSSKTFLRPNPGNAALASTRRGEFASEDDVEAMYAKHGL